MSKSKVPQIRFKGFSEEWEDKILYDLSESFEYGLNSAATKYDGKNKYIRITDIDDKSRKFNTKDLTSPQVNLEFAENYKLQKGDILFARTGASVGKTYIYKENDGLVYYAGFLIRARIKQEINADFIFQNTLTKKYDKFIKLTSQRSGQPGVNAQEYSSYKLFIPNHNEQTKIGNYFQQLDKLIEQKEKKYQKLKQFKKAMLDKMFPKNGADTPEIRFKGFIGKWEEKEINELFIVTRGDVLAATETSSQKSEKMPYPVYSSQTKNNGLLGFYKKYLFENAITWTTDGANAGTVKYREGKFYSTNVNGVLLSNDGYANLAIAEILNNIAWKHVSYVGNPKLMNNVMSKIKIIIPNTIEEQIQISKYIKQLDKQIDLQQKELEKLKNIKKASLAKMFV
ncbi:restriction endonuclease subunit S [Aliarcobacter butzleri]|uniref:restriction endonuclease subunit S n=1 Tax=Aliarcobacter butzleri TaxID=28197 RepID=UPI001EDC30BD|nr:restriction endonuclease subunit S [Aliarcobacter butzleri]MCG3666898.1 restriction endonuclease subunit S [Aliarcobacter butzleri]